MNFLDNMPYFDNFILDSIVFFVAFFLVAYGLGFIAYVVKVLNAIIRGLFNKLAESIKKTKNDE